MVTGTARTTRHRTRQPYATAVCALILTAAVTSCTSETGNAEHDPPQAGDPLPYTRFVNQQGEVVDLARHRGTDRVLLVFMRGFDGYVCPYCTRQTSELAERYEEITAAGTRVYIVYPGPAETVPVFLEAVRRQLNGQEEEFPVPVLLDVDLSAVKRLGIRGNLAAPSTFLVGSDGVLQYVYVGNSFDDRPDVDDILSALHNQETERTDREGPPES
mgnify:CR=1 FL=1